MSETQLANVQDAQAAMLAAQYMPIMQYDMILQRQAELQKFRDAIMIEGEDYGVIPGTGSADKPSKPVLLKPGAEKLCTLFGLTPHFEIVKEIEEWGVGQPGDVNYKPAMFYYWYRCSLFRGDFMLGQADGCNTRESKYRWRSGERKCPDCNQGAIIRGKEEYGGGWLCYKAKGGCGAKFAIDDLQITGQAVGRVENPDVADLINTIQKMAQKRALVAAILICVNASAFFTQDLEDSQPADDGGQYHAPKAAAATNGQAPAQGQAASKPAATNNAKPPAQKPQGHPDDGKNADQMWATVEELRADATARGVRDPNTGGSLALGRKGDLVKLKSYAGWLRTQIAEAPEPPAAAPAPAAPAPDAAPAKTAAPASNGAELASTELLEETDRLRQQALENGYLGPKNTKPVAFPQNSPRASVEKRRDVYIEFLKGKGVYTDPDGATEGAVVPTVLIDSISPCDEYEGFKAACQSAGFTWQNDEDAARFVASAQALLGNNDPIDVTAMPNDGWDWYTEMVMAGALIF